MSQLAIVEYFVKDQASATIFEAIAKERQSAMKDAGCEKIERYVNQDDANHIVTLQQWTSREHQAEYVKWARAQPNEAEFSGCWASQPRITWVDKTKT